MKECDHDYENPERVGRAHWVCPKCKKDITLTLAFILQSEGQFKQINS